MKDQIEFSEFLEIEKKLDIRIGTIKIVDRVPKSDKLLQLTVSFGDGVNKTVVTNIGDKISDIEELRDLQLPFIMNLKPAKMMGIVSEAMIMVAVNEEGKIQIKEFSDGAKLL